MTLKNYVGHAPHKMGASIVQFTDAADYKREGFAVFADILSAFICAHLRIYNILFHVNGTVSPTYNGLLNFEINVLFSVK